MPYYLSERVNLRFVGDPDTAMLALSTGEEFTVSNGGLARKSDGGLICEFQLPSTPGDVTYRFTSADHEESGTLRVVSSRSPQDPGPPIIAPV